MSEVDDRTPRHAVGMMQSRNHPFSDLEVAEPRSEGPFVYESCDDREANLPQVVPPPPSSYATEGDKKTGEGATVHHEDNHQPRPFSVTSSRRILYLAILIAVLGAVGIVLGAVLGVRSNRDATSENPADPSGSDPSSPTDDANRRILSNSALSATNLTDGDGRTHRRVFFQDRDGAILLRR